ncbi:uncharacterized protein HD556DRAFT_1428132 [Suillus plorans]|uniref:CxC2-like cysteine cluster KDZ transposase-associated domain-containing protein n=1 Tax=Suillus plorans TaxID=116603 RepID=A0A9P7J9L8_9AGAM|nr:uncharacterized protein HD556DRAFT_1428132 [Suillus plorans]KAG1809885.1 hypothetical protein HD556DRAFT_1428132 [Suillus plorans]
MLQCWNGTSFQTTMLKALGVRFQLGHSIVGLDFCGCEFAQPHITQLLHVRLFPATTGDPKSAATFHVLEYFQMLSFESKVSAWEFYNMIARLTDNTGTRVLKDRYEPFLRMIREWHFIIQMKHCSQGHHPGGIEETKAGACAILCPACPHPSKNLPVGWENTPPEFQFLDAIFLAIDANFQLVYRNVSLDAIDPRLNHGYAFFVEETAYKDILASRNRKSTCSSHSAVNLADTRASYGLAATGAGTIDCVQHNFKHPCSVGDLQKGERYINMDYLFFSSMRSSRDVHVLNISYDIACQWNKKLWSHMLAFPHEYHINHDEKVITFFVPKFHLLAHITSCQTKFSFNFIKGVGRTDGEAPEHGWADINPLATSTRKMGPGSRRDTIDVHFNDWNWKKESDRSLSNPFEMKERTSMCCFVLENFISLGMELEDQQQCVEFEVKSIGQHATDTQKVKILQHINALCCRIGTWSCIQLLYMPHVSCLQSPDDITSEDKVHKINLFLPSSLPSNFPCDIHLLRYKWNLREAQANDALTDLRTVINMTYHLYNYKDAFVRGQHTNTRAHSIIHLAEGRISAISAKYIVARDALIILTSKLGKNDDWQRVLKPLDRTKDAVPLKHDAGKTVGQQSISWIWRTAGVSNNQEEGLQDSLRVEWCKARAQAHQWDEEVQLLREEMRHVLAFLEWQAGWWEAQGSQCQFVSHAFTEGAVAYAHHQAMLRQRMSARFKSLWEAVPSWTVEPFIV